MADGFVCSLDRIYVIMEMGGANNKMSDRETTVTTPSYTEDDKPDKPTVEVCEPPDMTFEPTEHRHFGVIRYTVHTRFRRLMLIGLVNILVVVALFLLVYFTALEPEHSKGDDNIAMNKFLKNRSTNNVWMGLYCFVSNSTQCLWDSGGDTTVSYSSFDTGFPEINIGRCVSFKTSDNSEGLWESADCDRFTYLMCEVPTTSHDTCENNFNNNCYFPQWG
ncbi:unnamed protein product [Caenorhabditis brenneri]